jgi:hypothetical protein
MYCRVDESMSTDVSEVSCASIIRAMIAVMMDVILLVGVLRHRKKNKLTLAGDKMCYLYCGASTGTER